MSTRKVVSLLLLSIVVFTISTMTGPPQVTSGILSRADLSSLMGGLDIAYAACGIGVGALLGTFCFLTGGTAAIAYVVIAPKAAAACILAVAG